MKVITKYKALDGKEFDNQKDCLDYEKLIRRVNSIMKPLPPRPNDDGCKYSNGGGFLQHDKATLRMVKINLLEEIKKHIDHEWIQQSIDDDSAHPSYVDRLVGDHGISPLNKAWFRFVCIDKSGREWGQPYFANNPEKGEQVCVGGNQNIL